MIRDPHRLAEFEARDVRLLGRERSFDDALAVFAALWDEARALNPDFGTDWQSDLASDFEIARALNGLPPGP